MVLLHRTRVVATLQANKVTIIEDIPDQYD